MKLILKLLFVLISIATMVLISALFVEKEISIKEAITIQKPIDDVFNYVRYIDQQHTYFSWQSKNKKKKSQKKNSDGTIGYQSTVEFNMESTGKGQFRITELIPNKLIKCDFVCSTNQQVIATLTITTEPESDSVTVLAIELSITETYPRNIQLLFSKMNLLESPHLQKSVEKLKDLIESQE